MKLRHVFFLSLALTAPVTALLAGSSDGQSFSAITHSDATKEDIGDIHPEDSGGVLSHFRANASMRGEYTSNAELSGHHGSGDFLYLPTLDFGYNQPLGHGLALDFDAKAETVVYSDHHDHGFWGFSGDAQLEYRYRPYLPRIYVAAEPYRYVGFDTGDSVAEAIALTTGIDHDWAFDKGRSMISAGYSWSRYYASPSLDDRDTNRVVIALTHQFRPALFGQIFYMYQYTDYLDASRHDSRNIVGLNITYQFTQKLFGTIFSSFVDNDSSIGVASYQSANVGFGLTYQF